MKRFHLLWLTALATAGFLASCNSEDPMVKKYGLEFNKNRTELGLPKLPDNWKVVKSDKDKGILRWASGDTLKGAGFAHKEVTIRDNKLYSEENRFEGKNKYHRDGVDYTEEVYLGCYFDDKEQISESNCIFKGTRNPV